MSSYQMFFWGALGGCCPTFAKLAAFYTTYPRSELPELGAYVGLGLFAVLGGLIARGFSGPEVRAAMAAGIAAPAIVTNVIAGVGNPNSSSQTSSQQGSAALFSVVSAAHAQDLSVLGEEPTLGSGNGETLGASSDGLVSILPSITGGGSPLENTLQYHWTIENGEVRSEASGNLSIQSPQTIVIPDGAISLSIEGEVVSREDLERNGGQLDLKVETAPTLRGDLLWALGAQRSFAIQDVQIAQ